MSHCYFKLRHPSLGDTDLVFYCADGLSEKEQQEVLQSMQGRIRGVTDINVQEEDELDRVDQLQLQDDWRQSQAKLANSITWSHLGARFRSRALEVLREAHAMAEGMARDLKNRRAETQSIFVPTGYQTRILKKLDGQALTADALAAELNGDRRRLYRNRGIKELRDIVKSCVCGHVQAASCFTHRRTEHPR